MEVNNKTEKEFYSDFLFGIQLNILRKGKINNCVFVIYKKIPCFL